MNRFFFLVLVFISFNALSQQGMIRGEIDKTDSLLDYQWINILLYKDGVLKMNTAADSAGKFKLQNVAAGMYTLVAYVEGYSKSTIDSFMIEEGRTCNIIFTYPLPCNIKKYNARCCIYDQCHTDHIIPIVYGFPGKHERKRAQRGLVYLGGLADSECDPKYYCTIHKRRISNNPD